MQDLKIWEEKIKEKRKNTNFRDFVKEICSWYSVMFYKNKGNVSKYPETKKLLNIVSTKDYVNFLDTMTDYGRDYDFYINFFENYKKLFQIVPLQSLIQGGERENIEFSESAGWGAKNSYLSFISCFNVENILYSLQVKGFCKNVLNSVQVWDNSENIYMCSGVTKSYKIFYSRFITNCSDIWFCTNMIGCKNCILCNDLDNQSYCIKNKQYSKEEYKEKKEKYLGDKSNFLSLFLNLKKRGANLMSKNSIGTGIIKSSNIMNGFYVYNVHNGKNLVIFGSIEGNKFAYDSLLGGGTNGDYLYATINGGGENVYCSDAFIGTNIYYSYYLVNCSFCLGCIGLKNKSFCILNKQYSKEEWYELADKIFVQMEKDGILGDFFPGELNPFYFNDTMAYLIDDSFTKEEVEKKGFMWRDEKIKVDIPEGAEIVYSTPPARSSLPPQSRGTQGGVLSDYQGFDSSGNWKINPEILKKVIVDSKGDYYKIVQMEYDFLMKYGLPLPEIHWLERIKSSFIF